MSLSAMEEESQNFVVFDTDVGTDDAWALLMLIRAEEKKLKNIKILGVTCVHGNTEIEHVVRNVFRVLDTVNRPDVCFVKVVYNTSKFMNFPNPVDSGIQRGIWTTLTHSNGQQSFLSWCRWFWRYI